MVVYNCVTPYGTTTMNCDTECCTYQSINATQYATYCCTSVLLWYWILVIVVGGLLFIGSIVLICCRRMRMRRALLAVKEGDLTNRNMPLVIR